jgi:uncharacterized protein (DUF934 family)
MQIIKDREIIEDNWLHLDDEAQLAAGNITVSVARWNKEKVALKQREGALGVRISSNDALKDIAEELASFALVVVVFPAFTDGTCYSYARLLRERYGFTGEIRAQGDVLRDQIFNMEQCGINSFELANPKRLTDALSAFDEFTESYQTTYLRPEPLYRRR